MFVGEGPGANEDATGEPFVGRAGQLLDKIIAAMGMRRDDVYIANIVKCRPPGNRDPEPDEVAECEPFLKQQIAIIQPEAIVALGRVAAVTLLRVDSPLGRLRARWHSYEGIPLMPTYHPAFLLRSPDMKRKCWEDIQQVMRRLNLEPPGRSR
jgi:uracil-DNA glycosylase family 4